MNKVFFAGFIITITGILTLLVRAFMVSVEFGVTVMGLSGFFCGMILMGISVGEKGRDK